MTLGEEWQDIADMAANRIVHDFYETMSLFPEKQSVNDAFSFLNGIEQDSIN